MTASALKQDPDTFKAKQINKQTKTREKTKQRQTKQNENKNKPQTPHYLLGLNALWKVKWSTFSFSLFKDF